MSGFEYVRSKDIQEILNVLAKEKANAVLVAGATNVMNDIRSKKIQEKVLVDISKITELSGITQEDGMIRIGASTTVADIAESALLCEQAPALYQAAHVFADPITCNYATIGGNIAHACPAADTAPPLLALDAEVEIAKKGSSRTLHINNFFLGFYSNQLEDDELIIAIRFKPQCCSAFEKIGLRNAMSIAILSVAVAVEIDQQEKVRTCSIAVGAAAPRPIRATHAEAVMMGSKPTPEIYAKMAEALCEDISPNPKSARASKLYREVVGGSLLERVFKNAMLHCKTKLN
jgi:CO/xanthine dehydrogenase FAD-binding subunit